MTAIEILLAMVLGIAALNAQPQELPDRFVGGAMKRGEPTLTDKFIGLQWRCGRNEPGGSETCYAGWSTRWQSLETGP